MKPLPFTPRIIRIGHSPGYCGMDRGYFDKVIRPLLPEPMSLSESGQAKGWERVDLDAAIDVYKARHGRPDEVEDQTWDAKERRGSRNAGAPGTSTSRSKGTDAFARALEQATSKKPSDSSRDASSRSGKRRCTG